VPAQIEPQLVKYEERVATEVWVGGRHVSVVIECTLFC
jgi:hypothetical protein